MGRRDSPNAAAGDDFNVIVAPSYLAIRTRLLTFEIPLQYLPTPVRFLGGSLRFQREIGITHNLKVVVQIQPLHPISTAPAARETFFIRKLRDTWRFGNGNAALGGSQRLWPVVPPKVPPEFLSAHGRIQFRPAVFAAARIPAAPGRKNGSLGALLFTLAGSSAGFQPASGKKAGKDACATQSRGF